MGYSNWSSFYSKLVGLLTKQVTYGASCTTNNFLLYIVIASLPHVAIAHKYFAMILYLMASEVEPIAAIVGGVVFIGAGLYDSTVPYVGILVLLGIALLAVGIYQLVSAR